MIFSIASWIFSNASAFEFSSACRLACTLRVELVDLLLEIAALLVQRIGRQGRLLALQRISLLPQRLLLVRNLLGVFVALLLDLLAHHFGRF